jgi:hypothetical protein
MKVKLFIFLFFCTLYCYSQAPTVLTVTKIDYDNGAGSFANELFTAQGLLQSGVNVIINLNAPGLIKTDAGIYGNFSILMGLSGTATLTIQKDPSLAPNIDQGFIWHSYYNSTNAPNGYNLGHYGAWIVSTSPTTGLKFSNLKFKDFEIVIWGQGGPVNNLEVSDCKFEDVANPIALINFPSNILIQRNQCYRLPSGSSTTPFGYFGYFIDLQLSSPYAVAQCTITNNTITGTGATSNSYGIIIECNPQISSVNTCSLVIKNNNFNNIPTGIYWLGVVSGDTYVNANIILDIQNNSFNSNGAAFLLLNPVKTTTINGNSFNNSQISDFYIQNNNYSGGTSTNFGLDFIGPNSLGLTQFNGNNIFLGSSSPTYNSFIIDGSGNSVTNSGFNIVGLNLPGQVSISSISAISNVKVQETKIHTLVTDQAIGLYYAGNNLIDGPTMTSANLTSGNVLSVTYNLNANEHVATSAPFAVEFFRCSSNGDLLDYIGRQQNASPGNNFNFTTTLPSTIIFSSGDKLGATVTSYGTSAGATPKGTSMTTYPLNCLPSISSQNLTSCLNTNVALNLVTLCPSNLSNTIFNWNFGNGTSSVGPTASTTYNSPGTYTVTVTATTSSPASVNVLTQTVQINACQPPQPCTNCIGSFEPNAGDYMVNLWVREDINPQPPTYNNAKIQVSFTGNPTVYTFGTNPTKNKVIEGWQRIEEKFTIPTAATFVNLKLINVGGSGQPDAFFDDIRIFPVDGQMKTYVYDPLTMRLSAMLDENNYATLYEYDEEGKLIRVKKETEKGIMTLQESREGLKKQ